MRTIHQATEVLELLSTTQEHRYAIKQRLLRQATTSALVRALVESQNALEQMILCDVLGRRQAKSAIPSLVSLLDHEKAAVRSAAAESLAKIGDVRVGETLLNHFELEQDLGVKRMYAGALGAVKYTPAVPTLITALLHNDPSLRGGAAWSLGLLGGDDVLSSLAHALHKETDAYVRARMQEALNKLHK